MTDTHSHPDDFSNLRSRAEESIRAGEAKPEEPLATAELKRLVHELQVHQIELETQNEELRRTQSELELSRAQYFDLFNLAPVGYFTLSDKGVILGANITGANLLGVGRHELLQQPLTRHIFPDDQDIFCKHRRQLFATHSPQVCELRMVKKDGAPFWVRLEAKTPQDNENGHSVYQAVVSDITEQKREQDALRRANFCVEQAGDGIFWLDPLGQIVFANQKACDLLEYSREELQAMTVFDIDPLVTREFWGPHWEAIRKKKAFVIESCHRTKTGRTFPVEIGVNYMTCDGKEYNCAFARDITHRKRAEELLRKSEEKLSSIIQNAAETIYTLSLDGVIAFVSPTWTQALGHDVTEVEGQSFVLFIHPEDVAVCQDAIKRVLATEEPQRGTYRIRHKDGSWRWHHSVGALIKDHQGRPAGFVGVAEDVTDRKRAEEMLRASEEKYRTYINNSPTGVFVADSTGRYVEVNASACRLLGYSEDELTRMGISDIVAPEDVQSAMAAFHEMLRTGSTVNAEYCFVRKDGSRIVLSVDAVKVQEDRAIGFCVDITKRINAEQLLKQSSEALQYTNQRLEEACGKADAANRAKSEFLANMSHEIRTPMTAIIGYADVLLDSAQDQDTVEALQIIKRNGHHLLGLINDILDLSKIEAGKQDVSLQACSPQTIASEVVGTLRIRAEEKGLGLSVACEGDLPERITTDPSRLRQILVNLVGNAIKFTEVGNIQVVMRLDQESEGNAKLLFDVSDTGIGMSAEQIGLLFKPFSQVDGSAHRRFGGTGLGLAISKRLAGILGGDIVVRSRLGQGSTFSLVLDVGSFHKQAVPQEPRTAAKTTGSVEIAHAAVEIEVTSRVLLAEDNSFNQQLIVLMLRKTGTEVAVAENGQLAVEQARTAKKQGKPFDVILMDMMMPVMDGYEATRSLRSEGYEGPIIALTANAMTGDEEKCLDAGCDDYLSKPIDRAALLEKVATYSKRRPKAHPADGANRAIATERFEGIEVPIASD